MAWLKFAQSDDLRDRSSVMPLIAVLCAVTVYVVGCLLLAPSVGNDAITLAIVPVVVVGWLWGWQAGVVVGLLTIPLNILLLNLSNVDGWYVIDNLGGILGMTAIVIVGGLLGFSRDLNRRAQHEIQARQRAEAELRENRDHLEQIVKTRTAELQHANERLQQALEREHELNELKSRFVGMVSHEYRSPLTTILNAVSLLQRYESKLTDSEKASTFQKVEAAVHRMTQMLDDVLGFNNFEVNTGEITLVPVSAAVFCRAAVEIARTAFRASQTFNVVESAGNCQFLVDKDLLEQALLNLLSNAVRYSAPDSTITVNVGCDSEQVLIHIHDEGSGIPTAEQGHIFEPFYRAQNVENIAGTGLGLVFSKRAVEIHGGTLTFESAPNKGTTFTLMLPIRQGPTLRETPSILPDAEKTLHVISG